jgi:hypothetical protein
MRCIAIAFLWIASLSPGLCAQERPRYDIDTGRSLSPGIDTLQTYPYFRVKGKYPESSQTLAKWANQALDGHNLPDSWRGYITFHLLIDCRGKIAAAELLQTNERFEPCFFPKNAVDDLYIFVRSLDGWRQAAMAGRPVNYLAYLSFKIENGHVVQVSP